MFVYMYSKLHMVVCVVDPRKAIAYAKPDTNGDPKTGNISHVVIVLLICINFIITHNK